MRVVAILALFLLPGCIGFVPSGGETRAEAQPAMPGIKVWSGGCGFLHVRIITPEGHHQPGPQKHCLAALDMRTLAAGDWMYEAVTWNGVFRRADANGAWNEPAADGIHQWVAETQLDGWYNGHPGLDLAVQVDFPVDWAARA